MLNLRTTLRCGDRLLDLSRPRVMGILNLTPDSFFDGGRYREESAMLRQVERMLTEGADLIDLGAMSSRPGADVISVEEELARLMPALQAIVRRYPEALISVDTVHGRVAREAAGAGARLINDISAGRLDPQLWPTVAELGLPYVLMHMQGEPRNMQQQPQYGNVVLEVMDFLLERVGALRRLGVQDIILDPGFGFGKTVEHNYTLIRNLHTLLAAELPLLAGVSRKSMIGRLLGVKAAESLNGTSVLHLFALQQGATFLRVHDVKEAVEVIRIWEALGRPGPPESYHPIESHAGRTG